MPKELCFVVTPISKTQSHEEIYWKDNFEYFLKPLIERTGIFEAERSEALRGDILSTIIRNLVRAKAVVVDITDSNPNVFWELGVRQSFKNGTITIAENGSQIPFDLSKKGILWYYPNDHIKNSEFTIKFLRALQDILDKPDFSDSQVLDTMSGRGSLYEIFQKQEILRRIDGLINEIDSNCVTAKLVIKCLEEGDSIDNLRYRKCSLELLLTHRYLDQTPTFYDNVDSILTSIEFDNSSFQCLGGEPKKIINCFTPTGEKDWKPYYMGASITEWENFKKNILEIKKAIEASY